MKTRRSDCLFAASAAIFLVMGLALSGCDCSGTIKSRADYIGELTVEPAQLPADGQSTAQITVRVLRNNADSAPAAGVMVMLASSRNIDTIGQPASPTDAEGLAVAQVSSLTVGEAVLTATVNGKPLCGSYAGGACTPAEATVTFVCPAGVDCCEDADCDDGLFCNGAETCADRTCQAGQDPCPGQACNENQDACGGCRSDSDCDDGVGCTADTCNPADNDCRHVPDHSACAQGEMCDAQQGCVTVPCQDSSECDDGLFCNGAEVCDNGGCTGQALVNCDDGVSCTADSCNEDDDGCDNIPDAGACDDGVFCNGPETCDAVNDCQPGADPCAAGGQACDEDGDVCYSCGDGVVHSSEDCDPAAPQGDNCCDAVACTWIGAGGADPQGVCAGAPECQLDVCDGSGGCSTMNVTDGTSCTDDGLFCTGLEVCQDGACAGAGNPCSIAANCDEANDICAGCGDGNVDTSEDCDPAAPQSDNCCDPVTCQWTASGVADPQSACSGAPECQIDVCDGSGGCTTANAADQTPCTSDGLFCNGVEECRSGSCLGPGDPCPGPDGDDDCSESCDETGDGCTANDTDGSACNDGTYCNGTDTCSAGGCSGHAGDPCPGPDGDGDCSETCNETSGDCSANDTDGSACAGDGDDCTRDICAGGACTHPAAPVVCGDGNVCGAEECDTGMGNPDDCTSPEVCLAGCTCDLVPCDGSTSAPDCSTDADCDPPTCPLDVSGDCVQTVCEGVSTAAEFQICSNAASGGAGAPCESTTCNGDDEDGANAVGTDCLRSGGANTHSTTFNTQSPSGTSFMVWLRIYLDTDWDAGEQYGCSLDGVNGGGTLSFLLNETALGDGTHGPGCAGVNGAYCWAAYNLAAVVLDQGPHTLSCSITTNRASEWGGHDGVIFTTDLAYVPDPGGPACDDDSLFTAGTCDTPGTLNWGPNVYSSASGGKCNSLSPVSAGTPCEDGLDCSENEACDGSGTCAGGTPVDCDDLVACTDDDCVEGTGCVSTPNNGLCDDGSVCTINTCSPTLGCQSTDNDGVACTVDTCSSTCLGGICDGCESPVDPGSLVYTTSSCLTEGTNARAVLAVELKERDGTPITGADVTIEADDVSVSWTGAVVESTAQPGTYYRTMVAASAAVGSTEVTFTADAGSGGLVVLDNTVTVRFAAPVLAPRGGTGGCTPIGANLRVRVIESETGTPLQNAYVMVGSGQAALYEDNFEDMLAGAPPNLLNTGQTGAGGTFEFIDHGGSLAGRQMVTAGIAGRNYFSLVDVNASDIVLPLSLLSNPVTTSTINGSLSNFNDLSNDAWVDGALTFANLPLDAMLKFNLNDMFARTECWFAASVPLMGDLYAPIPGNVYVPSQVQTYMVSITIREHRYTTYPIPNGTTNLLGLSGKIPWNTMVDMLLNGTGTLSDLLNLLTPTEIGVIRNKTISGNETGVNIPLDYNLTNNVAVTIDNNPTASDVLCSTFGDWNGTNGVGPLFPMGLRVLAYDSTFPATIQVGSVASSGPFAGIGYLGAAVALYMDGSRAGIPAGTASGISSILDRSLANYNGSGGAMTFGSFFDISPLTEARPAFSFVDVSNSNSPDLDYTEHRLDRVLSITYVPDPANCPDSITEDVGRENYWTILAPATTTAFTLPALPAGWPRQADGGLMNPASTAAQDRLNWAFAAYHLGLLSAFDFNLFDFEDFIDTVTHSSFNNRDF